jgi:hypothetical protein
MDVVSAMPQSPPQGYSKRRGVKSALNFAFVRIAFRVNWFVKQGGRLLLSPNWFLTFVTNTVGFENISVRHDCLRGCALGAPEANSTTAPSRLIAGRATHTHWTWKLGIKLPHVVAFVPQSHCHDCPRGDVQHRHCLLASVQVTSYNSHLGLLRSEHC